MSTDANNTEWDYPHSTPSTQRLYPTSGAAAHLPIRTTTTGDRALISSHTLNTFLRDLPAHCWVLPNVQLNFTIVEILALLPNWFKDKLLCARFMNNKLTAQVHFMILEEHRNLQFETEFERDRARKSLTDEYRKTMRTIWIGWTKAKQFASFDWDPSIWM